MASKSARATHGLVFLREWDVGWPGRSGATQRAILGIFIETKIKAKLLIKTIILSLGLPARCLVTDVSAYTCAGLLGR